MTTDAWAPTRMPLANAPVSFGFWGPHAGPQGVSGRSVLHAVAAAGYAGSELGPAEHLGDVSETAAAYLDARLQCAGVHLGLHLQDPDGLSRAARLGLADVCRRPVAVQHAARQAGAGQAELPLGPIVLADEGSSILRDHPARAPADRSSALDDATWKHAVQTITEAQQVISEHGLATSFHPHLATHVESAWEVERLLSTTGVGITLDTGHLLLAGADPVACLRSWGDRVDHIHLKDVRVDVLLRARAEGRPRIDHWWGEACVPFGSGDVDLTGVLTTLTAAGYRGWIVVEQDHTPSAADTLADLGATQRANLEWLVQTLVDVYEGGHPAR